MVMGKNLFTEEQLNELKNNPFTLSVNEQQIRFTVEFKKYLLDEREKNNTPWKEVFSKAGYDPAILGKSRMDAIINTIRKEAASPKGLHETTTIKVYKKGNERKQTQKAIEQLQNEVIRLQQQIDFLKKIQMLKVLEENED